MFKVTGLFVVGLTSILSSSASQAASELEQCTLITDQADVIYLNHVASGNDIDTVTFLENAPVGIHQYWGESRFSRTVDNYNRINDAFVRKDFVEKVTADIERLKPELEGKQICIWHSIEIGDYDFEQEQFSLSFPDQESAVINSNIDAVYSIAWSYPADPVVFKPETEALARKVEGSAAAMAGKSSSQSRSLQALYFFKPVTESDSVEGSRVNLTPIAVEVYRPRTRPIKFDKEKSLLFRMELSQL